MRKPVKKTVKGSGSAMDMNYSRAVTVIKSECPRQWARMHAKAMSVTRERYGMKGVLLQTNMLVEALGDWEDPYGAAAFLRDWVAKHRKEIDDVVRAGGGSGH